MINIKGKTDLMYVHLLDILAKENRTNETEKQYNRRKLFIQELGGD